MIIEDANGKFYCPDSAAVLDVITGKYTLDKTKLIPYGLYLLQEELKTKELELTSTLLTDAELLLWAKGNHPNIQQKALIQSEIDTLTLQIKNYVI